MKRSLWHRAQPAGLFATPPRRGTFALLAAGYCGFVACKTASSTVLSAMFCDPWPSKS